MYYSLLCLFCSDRSAVLKSRFPHDIDLVYRDQIDNLDKVKEKVQACSPLWEKWAKEGAATTGAVQQANAKYRKNALPAKTYWESLLPELEHPEDHPPTEDQRLVYPVPEDHPHATLTEWQLQLVEHTENPPVDPSAIYNGAHEATAIALQSILDARSSGLHMKYPKTTLICLSTSTDGPPKDRITELQPGDASRDIRQGDLVLIKLEPDGTTAGRGWEIAWVKKVRNKPKPRKGAPLRPIDVGKLMDVIFVHPVVEYPGRRRPFDPNNDEWPENWPSACRLRLWPIEGKRNQYWTQPDLDIEETIVWYTQLRAADNGSNLGKLTPKQQQLMLSAISSLEAFIAEHGTTNGFQPPCPTGLEETMADDDGEQEFLGRSHSDDDDDDDGESGSDMDLDE